MVWPSVASSAKMWLMIYAKRLFGVTSPYRDLFVLLTSKRRWIATVCIDQFGPPSIRLLMELYQDKGDQGGGVVAY